MRLVAPLVALVLLCSAAPAIAWEDRNAAEKARDVVVDVLVARPLGLGQLLVGAAAFVVAGPVDLVWPEDLDAYQVCIEDPWHQAITRPIGRL